MRLSSRLIPLIAIVTLIIGVSACASAGEQAAPVPAATSVVSDAVAYTPTPFSGEVQPATTEGAEAFIPAEIPETRRLTLEFPPKMRAGVESEIVILTLEVDDLGNITPTAQFGDNVVMGEVIEIPNVYETHNVTVEARLDLAGMEVSPSGATFEPLKPGQSVTFYWSIRPRETGTYRGTAWVHLIFANKLSGEESRIAVSAQLVEIEAVDFFGLSVNVARTSGVIGSVIGGVIGFPFLEDILKFLFKKRKRTS